MKRNIFKKLIEFSIPVGILLVAVVYRIYGLWNNHPFWVDEFSSAQQARLLLQYGVGALSNSSINIEQHNLITPILISPFFKLVGQQEGAARLPFAIIGSFVPLLIYFVGLRLYDRRTGLTAAILTCFSYFQIVWSRQARGYVLAQFLIILSFLLYLRTKDSLANARHADLKRHALLFASVAVIGLFAHGLYLIFLGAVLIDVLLFNSSLIKKASKTVYTYVFLALALLISFQTGLLMYIGSVASQFIGNNNLWYYHSFLWREYGLVSFLATAGFVVALFTKRQQVTSIVIFTIFQLIFVCFLFPPYTSRYLLPIFPFLFLQGSYAIVYFADLFFKANKLNHFEIIRNCVAVIIALSIVYGGHKFVKKPQQFYSVNHDFREIALVDYDSVYSIIKEKGDLKAQKTAVIDTWLDRMYWYVGDDYPALYMFRWINEPGLVNGLSKKTYFELDVEGEKIVPRQNNLRFIGELKDLKLAMKKYPKGFIFIDDTSMPRDVIDFVEQNFKKELYLDHYPLDDNPYSIWPATLYSWGIN